jgi:guanylate kinase
MNIPIFCIVGKTGAGKSTFLNRLLKDDRLVIPGFSELIYHTTRNKRYPDEQGYHFVSYEEFDRCKHAVVESRVYSKYDNDSNELTKVAYYTTWSDIYNAERGTKGYLCAASVDQGLSYLEKLQNIFFINISVDPGIRLMRLLDRVKQPDGSYPTYEVQEIFRRIDEEEEEYSRLFKNEKINKNTMINIVNDTIPIEDNLSRIIDFIYDKVF